MPNIVNTEIGSKKADFARVNFDYDYPEEVGELDPKGQKHRKILDKLMKYARESAANMSSRFDSWNEVDRTLTAFIETDDKEDEITYNDPRKPVSIVFPYSYAIMETILAYLVAAFFQDPLFRYEGVSPEDTIGAILMEKTIDLHCNKTKVPLNLHTMFRDSLGYGVGLVTPYWKVERGFRVVKQRKSILSYLGRNKSFEEKGMEEAVLFEGNALANIDPYLALPDPNVSIHEIQEGEFFGWVERTNVLDLLSREEQDGDYFNVKYLNTMHTKSTSIYGKDSSDREKKWSYGRMNRYHTEPSVGSRQRGGGEATRPTDVVHIYAKIIPKEWELGDRDYPEKWLFSIGADSVIIRAKKLGLTHNRFPVAATAPDYDGYSALPVSRLEMLYGLQKVLDWMFNMHIANVRKAINDMIIYDPYLVNSRDLSNPGPGKLIRMRRPAWGRGVKDAVMQLGVVDVTKQHVADSSWIVNWMQKIGAADDVAMGALRQSGPERVTKAEFQGTQYGQMSRLGRLARVIGLQAMQDIGYMFAHHAQQMMEEEQYISVNGRWQEVLMQEYGLDKVRQNRGKMKVSPLDILVNFDVKVRDGSVPGGNSSETFVRLFETIGQSPELMQHFDITRIFQHIARSAGAKNVQEFKRIKVVPDEVALQQAQAGQLRPVQGGA